MTKRTTNWEGRCADLEGDGMSRKKKKNKKPKKKILGGGGATKT